MRFSKKAAVRKSADVVFGKGTRLVNCTLKDGQISPRKGLVATGHRVGTYHDSNWFDTNLEMTDCYIYDDGELARVAVFIEDDMMANMTYRIKLVFTNGRVKDLSQVNFSRTDYNIFGRPSAYTIFSGEPTVGCGIYFMARRSYEDTALDNTIIYELSDDKTLWRMVTPGDYYTPTIFANGRGNAYRAAELSMGNFEFPDPVYPQSENLLTNRYKANYTADSQSYYFKLPHPCTSEYASCRFNYYGKEVLWRFYEGEEYATAEIDGQKITSFLSRNEGSIAFMREGGADFPLPYDGTLNNITVEAPADKPLSDLAVSSKTGAVRIDAGLMSEGSAVTAFYGGWKVPAAVVFNSPLSPLYFPADEMQIIGEESTPVLKLDVCTDTLVAVRRESVYVCPIKGVTLPQDKPATSLGAKTGYLKTKRQFTSVISLGNPPLAGSIIPIGSSVFFVDNTGEIKSFAGKGKTLSGHGKTEVSPLGFGIVIEGRYCYINDKTACFAENDSGIREMWTFHETIEAGFTFLGKTVLIGNCYYSPEGMHYTAVFGGDEDTHFFASSDGIGQTNLSLRQSIEAPLFERLSRARKLFAARVSADAENIEVSLTADGRCHPTERFYMSGENNYIICSDVARTAKIKIAADGGATIYGVSYEYTEMNKM